MFKKRLSIFLGRFLRVWLQSLKKVLKWPKMKLFRKKLKKVTKNAEFHADFKSVKKVFKKCTKNVTKICTFSTFTHVSQTYFACNFFLVHFWKTFQRIWNQHEILRFLIPFLIKKKIGSYLYFFQTLKPNAQKTAPKINQLLM